VSGIVLCEAHIKQGENMKIEFFDKESGEVKDFQEDYSVNFEGVVFIYSHCSIYGYGHWRDKHTDWRIVNE